MKSFFKKIIVSVITAEAKIVLKKYKPKIVAVTGSVGKTSTKDAIFSVMSKFLVTRKSEKSFNSEIGLPLTILGCKNGWNNIFIWFYNIFKGCLLMVFPHKYPEWLVLEVGADKPGDIKSISSWLKTDVVVMTRIADIPVHIEQFLNQEEVVREKAYLVKTLKNGGTLVLNNDDLSISELKDKTNNRVITFGFSEGSTIVASNYHIAYGSDESDIMPEGVVFKIDYEGSNIPVRLNNVFGRQNVYTALAAFGVGISENLNLVEMVNLLREHSSPPGRFKLLYGVNGSLVVDDTYNSSPIALEVALQSFYDLKTSGKKIAILGDMLELGVHTELAHKKIGKMIPSICDLLLVVGERAKFFAEGALSAGMKRDDIHYFNEPVSAGDFTSKNLNKGDAVLVKGSQGMRMEKVVEMIIDESKNNRKNLVRQEKEWKKR